MLSSNDSMFDNLKVTGIVLQEMGEIASAYTRIIEKMIDNIGYLDTTIDHMRIHESIRVLQAIEQIARATDPYECANNFSKIVGDIQNLRYLRLPPDARTLRYIRDVSNDIDGLIGDPVSDAVKIIRKVCYKEPNGPGFRLDEFQKDIKGEK